MTPKTARSILRRETLGFAFLIVCVWVAEFTHLPHLLFGDVPAVNFSRGLLRTLLVLGIWLWVHLATRRLLRRLHELEEFLLVCGWCRKIGHEGRWLSMEEFFGSQLARETSHGICPSCAHGLAARNPPIPPPPAS